MTLKQLVEVYLNRNLDTLLLRPIILIEDRLGVLGNWSEGQTVKFRGVEWKVLVYSSDLALRKALLTDPKGTRWLILAPREDLTAIADILSRSHHLVFTAKDALEIASGLSWPPEINLQRYKPFVRERWRKMADVAPGYGEIIDAATLPFVFLHAAYDQDVRQMDEAVWFVLLAGGKVVPEFLVKFLSAEVFSKLPQGELLTWMAAHPAKAERIPALGTRAYLDARYGKQTFDETLAQLLPWWSKRTHKPETKLLAELGDLAHRALLEHPAWGRKVARRVEKGAYPEAKKCYNDLLQSALLNEVQRSAQAIADGGEPEVPIEKLEAHLFASAFADQIKALALMHDLATWVSRWHKAAFSTWDITQWATWYSSNGAYMDLAMEQLRELVQQKAPNLSEPAQRVCRRFAQLRDRMNRAFADVYFSAYEALTKLADKEASVLSVGRFHDAVLKSALDQGRVFLVIMDGMSYPSYLSLASGLPRDVTAEPACLLAGLPSITNISRYALFAGWLPPAFSDDEEAYELDQEASRNEDEALQQVLHLAPTEVRIFRKKDWEHPKRILKALGDERIRLVGLVVNYIDERVRSETQESFLFELSDIGPLSTFIKEALAEGRTVILCADHGFTPYFSDERRLPMARGVSRFGRYVILDRGQWEGVKDELLEGVKVWEGYPLKGKWTLLLTDFGAYVGKKKNGFHGGIGLEEIVVPCITLLPTHRASPLTLDLSFVAEVFEDDPVEIQARVTNHSLQRVQGLVATLLLRGEEVAEHRIRELGPHQCQELTCTWTAQLSSPFIPQDAESVPVTLRLESEGPAEYRLPEPKQRLLVVRKRKAKYVSYADELLP